MNKSYNLNMNFRPVLVLDRPSSVRTSRRSRLSIVWKFSSRDRARPTVRKPVYCYALRTRAVRQPTRYGNILTHSALQWSVDWPYGCAYHFVYVFETVPVQPIWLVSRALNVTNWRSVIYVSSGTMVRTDGRSSTKTGLRVNQSISFLTSVIFSVNIALRPH